MKRTNKDLLYAILSCDNSKAEDLIRQGASCDIRHKEHGETLLILASRMCSPETVELLLRFGANVNAADNRGRTALMSALFQGNKSMNCVRSLCRILLENGADPNATDNDGRSVLMWAVSASLTDNPDCEVVEMIINKGADVNGIDKDGKSVLMWAVEWQPRKNLIDILLRCGASINAEDDFGQTALSLVPEDAPDISNLLRRVY